MQADEFEALVKQWLASIPAVASPAPVALPQIVPLPFRFPERPIVEEVRWALKLSHTALPCHLTSGHVRRCPSWGGALFLHL